MLDSSHFYDKCYINSIYGKKSKLMNKKLIGYKVIWNGEELISDVDYYMKGKKFVFKENKEKYGTPYPKGQLIFTQEIWWE